MENNKILGCMSTRPLSCFIKDTKNRSSLCGFLMCR